jgi:hypothetical protein
MMQVAQPSADQTLARNLGLRWRDTGMVAAQNVSCELALAAGIVALDEA